MGSPATTTAATPPPRAGSLYDAYLSELFPATNSAQSLKGDDDVDVNDEEGDGLNVTKLDDDDALLPACNYFGHYPPPTTLTSHTNSNALSRNVCIITTAALPWRTGTAVNPLLRALHLIRYRRREQQNANNSAAATNVNRSNANNDSNSNNSGGGGKVALVIPWLISKDERIQLYGEQNSFSNDDGDDNEENEEDENENDNQVTNPQRPNYSSSNNNNNNNSNKSSSSSSAASTASKSSSSSSSSGMAKQEAWIRHYSATACQMPLESQLLTILFYPAFYQANFGSIFPKVDLCNYIPHELVDVAILEEPEHLNWFRMPYYHNNNDENCEENDEDDGIIDDDDDGDGGVGEDDNNAADANDDDDDDDDDRRKAEELGLITHRGGGEISKKFVQSMVHATASKAQRQRPVRNNNNLNKLGWTHRFRYVVGIVHTNYEEYARQYGIGVSLLAAPAVGAISALNIRAHCHKVLS